MIYLNFPYFKKQGCDRFVPLDHLTAEQRREAAVWALQLFGDDVDVWHLGERDQAGFFFRNEKDAMFFTLKWSS